MLVGTREGLSQFDGGSIPHHKSDRAVFPTPPSLCLYAAHNGDLWIGTAGVRCVFRLSNGQLTHCEVAGGTNNFNVNQIQEAGDGSIWLGASRGTLHWANQKKRCSGWPPWETGSQSCVLIPPAGYGRSMAI